MYWSSEIRPIDFNSPFKKEFIDFIKEKRSFGNKYINEYHHLRRFDRFLYSRGLNVLELPRELVLEWIALREEEAPSSQVSRISTTSLFAKFLTSRGFKAFILPTGMCRRVKRNFSPYIFSHEEISKIMTVAETLKPVKNAPFFHIVIAEVFRVIYTCGLRASEAANLKLADVDLENGILVIKQGKFRKDRLIPMSNSTTEHLRKYVPKIPVNKHSDPLFPDRSGTHYKPLTLYLIFRKLLWKLRIPHGGRNKGPRLHDLRHTFAVHRLEAWIKEGVDLNAKLPFLSTYLGHVGISGTQRYLKVTPGAFPYITRPLDSMFAQIKVDKNEHN